MTCLPALDCLHRSNKSTFIKELRNRRLGLLTNHTGCALDGMPALDVLRQLGLHVTALFSPEHGPSGNQEGKVLSGTFDNLPVYSLYGETRQPAAEMLAEIDVFICDLQDVGARFYTYSSTLALALEACAAHDIAVVVLDRPNPLGGVSVVGPLRDAANISFVGHLDIPIIHGMTMGELALLHQADRRLDVDLHVVPVQHWRRDLLWQQLNLPWRVPSPNLPDFQSAAWYPGLCLLEFSGVSVGRGTEAPFQIVGAPWMDPAKVLLPETLKSTFKTEQIDFTPTRGKWENELCHGLKFTCEYLPETESVVYLGMALLASLHQTHEEFEIEKTLTLLGSSRVLELLKQNQWETAVTVARRDAEKFTVRRTPFLLYDS